MKTAAVIAEFNPFHNGHAYILEKARAVSGADCVLTLMSGDFVQRGCPALMDRHVRARMALSSGADLVLSSPTSVVLSSAEGYAEGSLKLLASLNTVDYLVFGSECGDIDALTACAKALLCEDDAFKAKLHEGLKNGLSFPRARAEALPEFAGLLDGPNNILGIEYIKAILKYDLPIIPVTVPRTGNAHNASAAVGDYASASFIRERILAGDSSCENLIPESAMPALTSYLDEHAPLSADDFSFLLALALFKASSAEELSSIKNVPLSLARTIYSSRDAFVSFTQFAELVKSRSVTRTAVDRALMSIALSLVSSPKESGLFAHVLGFRESARPLLSALAARSEVPVILRPSRESSLPRSFREETSLSDLYNLVRAQKEGRPLVRTLSHRVITV